MKNSKVLLLAVLIFSGCATEKPSEASIIGSWRLQSPKEDRSGSATEPDTTIVIHLKQDAYERLENGRVVKEGTYKVIKTESLILNKPREMIEFDNDGFKLEITLESNKLEISGACYGCDSKTYVRD